MQILKDYSLKKLNTFGIDVKAKFFVEINDESEISEIFKTPEFKNNKKLFLGGGSNILFTQDFDGIVVLNKLKGTEILKEDSESVFIKSMGGEVWHDLVIFSVERGYWGLENLSLIPGTVGGAPVQNIGAYGAELKDALYVVEGYDIETSNKKTFNKEECGFGYRTSIFKTTLKDKFFITSVTFKLSKLPNKKTGYRVLKEYLEKNNIEVLTSKDVSGAVINIRKSKLPDPSILGNAGSFFKNVYINDSNIAKFDSLLKQYPELPFFEESGVKKIPAGWLVEQACPHQGVSWKGYRLGNVGVHDKQALVLVNYGNAKGQEIKDLSEQIISSVYNKFGLTLEREVNLI